MSPSHKECAPHDHKECAPQALIALSTLAYREYPIEEIEMYRNTVFGRDALNAAEFGRSSPMEKWYRSISSSAYPKDQKQLVFWKSTAKFRAENLFFRSVDTGRLVPLHLANFRLQWYADKRYCKQEEERGDAYRKAMTFMICGALHGMLFFRGMHDYGGSDIPVLVVNWPLDTIGAMMDYWIALSGGGMSKRDQGVAFCDLANRFGCNVFEPSIYEADLLVRALLSDPQVGYVPPFIVFMQAAKNPRVCALFTRPEFFPSKLLETFNFPTVCGAPACERNDCGLWEIKACRTLHPGSEMVRKQAGPGSRVLCNKWGCEVRHVSESGDVNKAMMRCQRCKEALYCSKEHQLRDWSLHKVVCEKKETLR